MNHSNKSETIRTRIWLEEAEPDSSFTTRAAYCHGYDVYGDMLGKAKWAEMLYLLFREDIPTPAEAELLENLALALANPGPRDPSVHAAMCGGVCGSTAASSLMAALAVGAGQFAGAREIYTAVNGWAACGMSIDAWRRWLANPPSPGGSVWPAPDHPPGFDPYGINTATPVKQTLTCLASYQAGPRLPWLLNHLSEVEAVVGKPLSMPGVAAAALSDLGFGPEQSEMLYLLLRLPGAAAHALEQKNWGYKKFPFGYVELENDAAEETR